MLNDTPQVLYIASCGRSGSTMLELLLNNHPNIHSLGEADIADLIIQGKGENYRCTCGAHMKACSFWSELGKQAKEAFQREAQSKRFFQKENSEAELKLEELLCKHKNMGVARWKRKRHARYHQKLLYLAALHLPLQNFRSFMKLFAHRYQQAGENAWFWFRLTQKISGCKTLVDSSKSLLRFRILQAFEPQKLKLIHLVRDVHGFLASQRRLGQSSASTVIKRWLRVNQQIDRLAHKLAQREGTKILRVGYDQLCAEPAQSLKKIFEFAQKQPLSKAEDPENNTKLLLLNKQLSHAPSGNPMRFRYHEQKIQADKRWQEELSKSDLAIIESTPGVQHFNAMAHSSPYLITGSL